MVVPAFLVQHQWALLFYATVIVAIVLVRKHIEWQSFGIGLYKTKVGLKLMDRWGKNYRGLVQLLGYIGFGIGFVGMVAIVTMLLHGFWNLLTNPLAPPVVGPVIPGINIPGFEFNVPLVTGWLALFCVVVIHEFSHGVVSRAHNVEVKSSGLLVFGPIAGAFVEPDEKKLKKESEVVQYSLFAAGPFSNMLTALIAVLFIFAVLTPLQGTMTTPAGVRITSVTPNYPAANASLAADTIITSVNNIPVTSYTELSEQLDKVGVGDTVLLGTDAGPFYVKTTANPSQPTSTKGYLGIIPESYRKPKQSGVVFGGLLAALNWFADFCKWFFILSIGIGLANLLPIGPLDGGRMLQTAARQVAGNVKRGDWWWKHISIVMLILIVVLFLIPLGRAII